MVLSKQITRHIHGGIRSNWWVDGASLNVWESQLMFMEIFDILIRLPLCDLIVMEP